MQETKLVCPICNNKIFREYFAFPKLPPESKFNYLKGSVHVKCLRSHPQKLEIQQKLKSIYIQIFEKHHDFPIVANDGYILIKSRPDCNLLEVYNFEDFVDFYIPYCQIHDILQLRQEEEIDIGVNKWSTVCIDENGIVSIRHNHIKKELIDEIKMPNLDINRLRRIMSLAELAIVSREEKQ